MRRSECIQYEGLYVIYLIENKINGKCCIGQSKRFYRRYKEYKRLKEKRPIGWAIQKYGWDNFTFTICEVYATREEADQAEIYWIDRLDLTNPEFGYNIQRGGAPSQEEISRKLKEYTGENTSQAKYTNDQVKEIREKFLTCKYKVSDLAKEYDINASNMSLIVWNKTYIDASYIITNEFRKCYATFIKNSNKGIKNAVAKYNAKQIKEMRNKFISDKYSINRIAKEYDTDSHTMSNILFNISYVDNEYIVPQELLQKFNEYKENYNTYTKLTNEEIKQIRKDFASFNKTIEELSNEYNLNYRNMSKIVKNQSHYDESYVLDNTFWEKYNNIIKTNRINGIITHIDKFSGENGGSAKFSNNQIKEIRNKALSLTYSIRELARIYSVDYKTMKNILLNKSYIDKEYVITEVELYQIKLNGKRKYNKRS